MSIQLTVEEQYRIASLLSLLYVGILCLTVGCIEINYFVVLICLLRLYESAVLLIVVVLAICSLKEGKILSLLKEFLI